MGEFRIVGEGALPTVPITSTVAHPFDPWRGEKSLAHRNAALG